MIIIVIHIDDSIVAAEFTEFADQFIQKLKIEFEMSISEVNVYLRLQIERLADGSIFLYQEAYTKRVLERFNLNSTNPVAIPMDQHQSLNIKEHKIQEEETVRFPYREAVGSLMYLSIETRPDITCAVNYMSRYLEKPCKIYCNAIKRILKYIKEPSNELKIYSDADYAGDRIEEIYNRIHRETGQIYHYMEFTKAKCSSTFNYRGGVYCCMSSCERNCLDKEPTKRANGDRNEYHPVYRQPKCGETH